MIDRHRRRCLLLFALTSRWHVIAVAGRRPSGHPDDKGVFDYDRGTADARSAKADDQEADDKHFMDVYSLQSGPRQLEFGHVFEDPNVWEQRYEKKDFDGQRYQGKVKWGDKDGGYGEQYWDLNHGGAGRSAGDDVEEYGRYEETTPAEHVQEETRRRPVAYKPMTVGPLRPKRKPVGRVRDSTKTWSGSQTIAPTTDGEADKKSATRSGLRHADRSGRGRSRREQVRSEADRLRLIDARTNVFAVACRPCTF